MCRMHIICTFIDTVFDRLDRNRQGLVSSVSDCSVRRICRHPNHGPTHPMNDWKLLQMIKACGWPPPPDWALRTGLTDSFSKGHTDARNRLVQTLRDWDRIAKKAGTAPAPYR